MIKNNKGAASILVVVMMLVLVVFGLAMVTTALAQARLSKSHEQWVTSYYDLEQKAQSEIYGMDQVFYQTEMELLNYMKVGAIAALEYSGPIINHTEYYEDFISETTRSGQSQYINHSFQKMYEEQLIINLEAYVAENDQLNLEVNGNISGSSEIEISGIVTNQLESYKKNISFILVPITPEYVLSYDGVRIDGYKDMSVADRYELISYEQWQEGFELDESIEFENPFGEPE